MQQQPVTSPARLPNRLLGGRPSQNRSSSMDEPDVYNMHTYSMPFQASKPQLEDGVQPANLFYVSAVLESSAARRFQYLKLSLWTLDEPHSRNITIEPKPQAENDPRHPLTPTANLPSDQHIVSCSLQLYVNEGSEAISPCTLEHQPGPLLANQRLLYEGMYPVQVGDDGRCLIGFFQASRPIYKVFAETSSVRSPDGPESEEPNFINHISARLLMPDSNRREMPDLAPELLEAIFLLSVERTCDWPGCKIHTKQNLSQLAQVNSTWLAVARRLHKTREATNKRLIDTCNIIDARHSAALPPALQNVRDPRRYFSLSSIFEGLAASKFDGVNLTIALYGSDLPVPDMQVTYLGREPEGPDAKVELDQQNDLSNERLLFPLHLRLDQWGASIENITGYALGIDQTWSSRMVWTGNILFNEPHPFHLGWFKASKPIAIDRDIGDSVPTHFVTRLSLPDPRRSRAKQLPATILERIFNAAAQYDDESIVGGPINFNLGAQAGWPAPPIPNWSWSQDLKRFAGVCKGWADVAKKLQQFEQTVANISGMTHASCMSFGDSVPEPNHIFAVTCVFEGRAASHFEGASLAICVPSDGIWADVDIEYIGDTWDGHKVLDTMPPALPTPQAHRDDSVCEVDHPICPISLCLCTSQDDADAYHVAIRDFPSTRPLCRRTIGLPSHSTQVFFGYFRSTRSFTGSASAAIPIHVVRISLPQPGRKRFAPLPDRIIKRIAWGVTELSDSTRRTECWSENLRYMSMINRQFREHASQVAWELAPDEQEEEEGEP